MTYKSNSTIEKMISDTCFSYEQPWFYNNQFAFRCELGMGVTKRAYLKNAKARAYKIFDILFQNKPDAVFFDCYIEDYIPLVEFYGKKALKHFRKETRFLAQHLKKYECAVINNVRLGEDERENYIQKNRVICYADKKYPYKKRITDTFLREEKHVHFVSFENECILSVYDDRGCDVVFATEEKMREFYIKLEPYFLEFDVEEMKKEQISNCFGLNKPKNT